MAANGSLTLNGSSSKENGTNLQNTEQKKHEYVYRLCRPDENPSEGLTARDPLATDFSVTSHVHGKLNSPFISTCKSKEGLKQYIDKMTEKGKISPGEKTVVGIDSTRLVEQNPEIGVFDLTDESVLNREFKENNFRGRNYATKPQQVLIKGFIPPDCVKVIDEYELEEPPINSTIKGIESVKLTKEENLNREDDELSQMFENRLTL